MNAPRVPEGTRVQVRWYHPEPCAPGWVIFHENSRPITGDWTEKADAEGYARSQGWEVVDA